MGSFLQSDSRLLRAWEGTSQLLNVSQVLTPVCYKISKFGVREELSAQGGRCPLLLFLKPYS